MTRSVRVQQTYDDNDPSVVFSSDGRQFVTMVWHGDLATNKNDYTVLLGDATNVQHRPTPVFHTTFTYEEDDQTARPLSQLEFLSGNRLAALATLNGEPRQVIAIDLGTHVVTPLTAQPNGVVAFAASSDGRAIVYAATVPAESAATTALYRNGLSLEDSSAIDAQELPAIAMGRWFNPTLQYFLIAAPGAPPHKIYERRRYDKWQGGRPHFWMAPDGRHALVYPWTNATQDQPTGGLIDVMTGAITSLTPTSRFGDGPCFGHGTGKSVVIGASVVDLTTTPRRAVRFTGLRNWAMSAGSAPALRGDRKERGRAALPPPVKPGARHARRAGGQEAAPTGRLTMEIAVWPWAPPPAYFLPVQRLRATVLDSPVT